MNDLPTQSGIIFGKMGDILFSNCLTTEIGMSQTPCEIDTEPLLSCREKSIRSFEDDVLRRENRELKSRCEKLAVQLRCKDVQRQAKGDKQDQANEDTPVSSTSINCDESEMKRLQCELETFRVVAQRVQESNDNWPELRNRCDNSMNIIAELNSTRREQDIRMEELVRSNKLLVEQLMKSRCAASDRGSKCEMLAAEVTQSASRISDLLQQIQQLKRALAEERKMNEDLTLSIHSAERASADSLSSLRSISTSNVSIANSQHALIEELRGSLKRSSEMEQIGNKSSCAAQDCPAAAVPPSAQRQHPVEAGDAESGSSCLTKRSRSEDPTTATMSSPQAAEVAPGHHSATQAHTGQSGSAAAEKGDVECKVMAPVRARVRAPVVPGKCPECAEAGFGLMVSCGECGASFHSLCARKVRQRLSPADPQQRFVCSDCASLA